jgi:peptide chain release factor 1
VVAVQSDNQAYDKRLDLREDSHFRLDWYSGSGAGGQNRNKKQNCARVTHIPTGIVKTAQTRDRENSKRLAYGSLYCTLDAIKRGEMNISGLQDKQQKTGSGERGDKIRTYRFQDDVCTDHRTGRKASTAKIMKGHFDVLSR